MRHQLTCSVIVPTYNRAELLGHTLRSLAAQTMPRDQYEVIVADDGSSDETEEVVDSFHDRLNLKYRFQPDEGFRAARARNLGIESAESGICVFLDSGMMVGPGFLHAHAAEHGTDRGPVAVVGLHYGLEQDDAATWALRDEIDLDDIAGTLERLAAKPQWCDIRETFWAKYGDDYGKLPAPWVIFWSANISVATESLRRVGDFDEEFRSWGGEDVDLGYRLHRDGVRFVLCREAAAVHLPHEKSGADNEASAQANYRYMARKYGTPAIRLLTLPTVGMFNLNDWIRDLNIPVGADGLDASTAAPAREPVAAAGGSR